ncbi:MAG: molybdopterin-dependent oxidoreductase [Campylobacterota bacterium]
MAKATKQPRDTQKVSTIAFPEKRPLITYSDRPPLLETPRDAFTKAITPNDEFFVRWHMPKIPTHTYISTYRINVNGFVDKPLSLSIKDLKENYEQVELTAVMQCGGNSRSAFSPTTSGIQWGSGAMAVQNSRE